jgi:acyl carrier protein
MQGITKVDLLKIDAQKSELDILVGIQPDDWVRIQQLVIEVHDTDNRLDTIFALLQRHGFRVFTEQEPLLEGTGLFYIYARRDTKLEVDPTPRLAAPRPLASHSVHDPISETQLRAFLSERLPAYMIPAAFVFRTSLPMTSTGKVDRTALRAEETTSVRHGSPKRAPQTEIERTLVEIWSELLSIEDISVDDDFFVLGGHSLLAIQLLTRIRFHFGVVLPLRTLFDAHTITELARHVVERTPPNFGAMPLTDTDPILPTARHAHRLRPGREADAPSTSTKTGLAPEGPHEP